MLKADFELSRKEKFQRVLYKTLRNELDYALIQYGIIEPYNRILKAGQKYRFVERKELRPRSKVEPVETELIDGFIVLFCERPVDQDLKKYIRYFDSNKVTKENLPEIVLGSSRVAPELIRVQRNFEHGKFLALLKALLPVDYALLIQPEPVSKSRTKYALTHFHVRIDWLIDFAAEALGLSLRYLSRDLYEKGEKYAQNMVEKLFEYYSFHHTVSGRRTAAVVASQLLTISNFISSVYVNSSESRTLTRISEEGIDKFCLIRIPKEHIPDLVKGDKARQKSLSKNYFLSEDKDGAVALISVAYRHNEHSRFPADGKLRELQPDLNWVKVEHQAILPKATAADLPPLPYNAIYS